MSGLPLMSLRAYAKRRGVTPMSVSLAVKDGRLRASVTRDAAGQPKINDPHLADKEWAANTDQSKAPAATQARAAETIARTTTALAAAGLEPAAPTLSAGTDKLEAEAELKIWQAKKAKLQYLEAAKLLVSVAKAKRRVSDILAACRARLLALPSRAKQSDATLSLVQVALVDELIREALEALSEPDAFE